MLFYILYMSTVNFNKASFYNKNQSKHIVPDILILLKKKAFLIKLQELQTDKSTWVQINCQLDKLKILKNNLTDEQLHLWKSFQYDYKEINIYIAFLSLILHQLNRKLILCLISWMARIVQDIIKPQHLKKKVKK